METTFVIKATDASGHEFFYADLETNDKREAESLINAAWNSDHECLTMWLEEAEIC